MTIMDSITNAVATAGTALTIFYSCLTTNTVAPSDIREHNHTNVVSHRIVMESANGVLATNDFPFLTNTVWHADMTMADTSKTVLAVARGNDSYRIHPDSTNEPSLKISSRPLTELEAKELGLPSVPRK